MRRAELYACPVALAVSACMKIYPDPELPDLEVEWYSDDECAPDAIASLSLIGVDDSTLRKDIDVACDALTFTFADVARERFRVEGVLIEAGGVVGTDAFADADLRDGLDDSVYLYLGGRGLYNFQAHWDFDMGASCESLGAETVTLWFSTAALPDLFGFSASCVSYTLAELVPFEDVYTVRAIAYAGGTPVAASPPTPELMISIDGFTDLGTLVLAPCTGACR